MENQSVPQKKQDKKLWIIAGVLFIVFIAIGTSQKNSGVSQPDRVANGEPVGVTNKNEQASDSSAQNSVSEPRDEKASDIATANKRFECKQEAYNRYIEKRNEECHKLKREDDCLMPPINYLPIEKEKATAMDECYKVYVSTAKFKGEDDFLKEYQREKCLNQAEQYYIDKWDSQCARFGRAKNCTLPVATTATLDDMLRGQRDECYMQYPTK
jgi:hypothetical protein